MLHMTYERIIADHPVTIIIPENDYNTLFYINENDISRYLEAYSRFEKPDFGLVLIQNINWFYDLTPWPALTVYETGPDFGGHAKEHLELISSTIIPAVESEFGVPEYRGIMGYSLGGLFSVYSFYETDLFCLCGCLSGSMWYDGFFEWMTERQPKAGTGSVYFSVGRQEQFTEYERMKVTGTVMQKAVSLMNGDDYDVFFEYTDGDHFENIPDKVEKGLKWLTGK